MYSIEVTSQLEPWFEQPALWKSLSRGVPFRQTPWLAAWWRHLGKNLTAYLVIARSSDGTVQGLLPLYRDDNATQGRTLRPIGDGTACTDDVSVLAMPEHVVQVSAAIGRFLANIASDSKFGWDLLDLDGIVEADEACTALARGLNESGATLHSHSRMSTWYKPCESSWDSYLASLSKSHRRALVQLHKKFQNCSELQYTVAQDSNDIDSSLRQLIELHQQRWLAAGQQGTYAEPEFRDFIADVVSGFSGQGMLFFPTLRQADKIIAAELHFVGCNNRTYCYSTGYNIQSAALQPGRLLNVQVLQHIYNHGWSGVDLLRGDEPYKERMGAKPLRVLRVRAVAPAIVPRLRHIAWKAGFDMKQWIRRHSGRKPIDVVQIGDCAAAQLQ